jgi:hypothetical protein
VDQFIFISRALSARYEVKEKITCVDCGRITCGIPAVKSDNYDRSHDAKPEFLCGKCPEKRRSS